MFVVFDRLVSFGAKKQFCFFLTNLLDDVIRIAAGESCALEETHDLRVREVTTIKEIFVFLQSDGAAKDDFLFVGRETAIRVVEYDLDEGRYDGVATSDVQEALPFSC